MVTYHDLEKFGLAEKEAKIYLASLELGPATAAQLAEKAGINRTTAYVEIESLCKRGLMSTYEKNKTTLFSAESPEGLKRVLHSKEEELKLVSFSLEKTLPELLKMYEYAEEKPKVRFFEGKEGLLAIQEDFLSSKDKQIDEIYSTDDLGGVFTQDEILKSSKIREKKKVRVRAIYVRKAGRISKISLPELTEMRMVPYERFSFDTDVLMYDNKVALVALKGKPVGIIIDHKETAKTMRSIFNLAWEAAEKYQEEK